MGVKHVYYRHKGKLVYNFFIYCIIFFNKIYFYLFCLIFNIPNLQGRTVDLKTLTLIEEPAAGEELDNADEEFERILRESGE